MKIFNDFYTGFEGEPEIQISYTKEDDEYKIIIWEGYFDDIMKRIPAGPEGWMGLAYYYNMYQGWYEEDNWEIDDINTALQQFNSISRSGMSEESAQVLEKICEILSDAIANNFSVFLSRE